MVFMVVVSVSHSGICVLFVHTHTHDLSRHLCPFCIYFALPERKFNLTCDSNLVDLFPPKTLLCTFVTWVSEFISLVTSEASEICSSSKSCSQLHCTITLEHFYESLKVRANWIKIGLPFRQTRTCMFSPGFDSYAHFSLLAHNKHYSSSMVRSE